MIMCKHGFQWCHGIHAKIWWKYYPQNFCAVGVFTKAIFSCLNLKPEDEFLPCSIPEVFNKIGYGPKDIIDWDIFKPVLHLELWA